MSWERFLPARFRAKNRNKSQISHNKIVADLDAIKAEPVGFVLHGKEFTIRPLEVETFFGMLEEYMGLMDLKKLDSITPEQLIEKYHKCFVKVIPDLKRDDVSNMTQQQCAALYELVMDTITGKVFAEKKKTYQTQKSESEPPQNS